MALTEIQKDILRQLVKSGADLDHRGLLFVPTGKDLETGREWLGPGYLRLAEKQGLVKELLDYRESGSAGDDGSIIIPYDPDGGLGIFLIEEATLFLRVLMPQ